MESSLSNRLAVFRNGRVRLDQQLENEKQTIVRLTGKIDRLKDESAQLVKAVALIDRCIEVISANGIGKIESVVSAGMHTVFQDKKLSLVVEKKTGARGTSYRLLIKHRNTLGDPMRSFGGGVQNVVAFLLRIILIKRFKLAKFLAIDESFSNVSANDYSVKGNYIPEVSEMLKTLANDHGFTILAITQEPELAAGAKNIYEVVPGNDTTPPTLRKTDYLSITKKGTVSDDETNQAQES